MTTYGAYNAGLPCKNPSCKSHGRPHPNCRCYGDMAKGGDVAFCSQDRAHTAGCEYFKDGGDVIDPSKVVMDEPAIDPSKVVLDKPISDEIKGIPEGGPTENQVITTTEKFPEQPNPLTDEQQVQVQVDSPEIDPSKVILDKAPSKYAGKSQQLAAAAEGFAQGFAGPLATGAELGLSALGVPGISAEDIKGRQDEHPLTSGSAQVAGLVGGLFTGVGEAALAAKAASRAAEIANLGKIGSSVVSNAIASGVVTGGNEVSDWLLGRGNPEDAVGAAQTNIMASMGIGAGFGLVGGAIGAGAKGAARYASEKDVGFKMESFLAGIAKSRGVDVPTPMGVDSKWFEKGVDFFHKSTEKLASRAGAAVGTVLGLKAGDLTGTLKGLLGGYVAGKATGAVVSKLSDEIFAPVSLKILSSNTTKGMITALNHGAHLSEGMKAVTGAIDDVFLAQSAVASKVSHDIIHSSKKKLDEWISNGGADQDAQQELYKQQENPEGFAKGGKVEAKPDDDDGNLGVVYPEQNALMSQTKGRLSNYLSALKPQKYVPKLAFDPAPDQRDQEKSYQKALDIAVSPLSVMKQIKNGTIQPEHIHHLSSMYPELKGLLDKKITDKIVSDQMKDKKPSYKVRQGLSLFLGTPLSSEFTQQSMAAVQAVFAPKQSAQQQQQGGCVKKTKQSLSKTSQSFLTNDQARVARNQKNM